MTLDEIIKKILYVAELFREAGQEDKAKIVLLPLSEFGDVAWGGNGYVFTRYELNSLSYDKNGASLSTRILRKSTYRTLTGS